MTSFAFGPQRSIDGPRAALVAGVIGIALAAVPAGCGDGGGGGAGGPPAGPYDDLSLTRDLQIDGFDGTAHVARDRFGVAHVYAESIRDLYFATGYVMAHDRLPQMDILRRFGAGTVAELFGIDDDALESDFEMRMHRFRPLSEMAWAELQASTDPRDRDIVEALTAFADGVNAYNADVLAGVWQLDDRILAVFDPERFAPWSPVDSLVLGKFQAFALSYTADFVLDATDVYQTARDVFDGADPATAPDLAARAGFAADLLRFIPIDRVSTIDGFPNVDRDTGSRSNSIGASRRGSAAGRLLRRALAATADLPAPRRATRPRVPRALLRAASRTHRPAKHFGPNGLPDGLLVPHSGSNNWVVGPDHAAGSALLAGDPHLSLPNPSVFYPIHMVIPGVLDVEGGTFPGIPGVLHGTNGKVAWASTVVFHDVNDVYLEQIEPCDDGPGDCVRFNGDQVPIETWTETFRIGSLGTIFDTVTVDYERVPHHGPILPTIGDRTVIPRDTDQALSVRYTGHDVTFEIRFLWDLNRADTVADAFSALTEFRYGGQNWVFIDADGNIGWSTHADVPLRDPNAYTWNADDAPDGLAPFFVLPGDGAAEWQGMMDPRYLPHAYNPPAGYLVTANSDPVGATFDGDPFNQPIVDGRPLYLSAFYAPGLRTGRIDRLLRQRIDAGTAMTAEDMAAIQTDSDSTLGARFQPLLATAAAAVDGGDAGVTAWLATLPADRVSRLRDAAARLEAWTLRTVPAVTGTPPQADIDDSVATTIFNVWGHFFVGAALGDEVARLDWDIYKINENLTIRVALALLEEPDTFRSGLAAETGQPVLCDDLDTPEVESCTLIALQSLDRALEWLRGPDAFDGAPMDSWRWGALHTLTLEPLFPNNELNIPPPNDPDPALRRGYPRAGDNFVINRADCTWTDLDFRQDGAGPAQRMIADATGGSIRIRLAVPGGTIYDPTSPHFRDLMDTYYIPNAYFSVPFATDEIVQEGEQRWVIRGR